MKKKILLTLPCVAAFGLAAFVGTMTLKSNSNESNSLLLENIEAMSQEEGVKRGVCYTMSDEGDMRSVKVCDTRTNPSMMYPCPQYELPIRIGLSDYCAQ